MARITKKLYRGVSEFNIYENYQTLLLRHNQTTYYALYFLIIVGEILINTKFAYFHYFVDAYLDLHFVV